MMKKTMRKYLVLSGLVVAIMSFAPVQITPPQGDNGACEVKNTTFVGGEELTYVVYYNWNFVWVAAGEVTFKVTEQKDDYFISAVGRTYKSYDWVFRVRDEYKVWIDKETLLPSTAVRSVEEGGYRLYDLTKYDYQKNEIRSNRGRTKEKTNVFTFPLDGCTHDILSILYYVRNQNYSKLKGGEKIPVRLFLDKEKYSLSATFTGRETKKIHGLGTFKTLKLMPEVIKGMVFNDTSGMTVWATDDKNRIPLQIESPLSVGTAKAILKSYKNTKYNLE
jgi:hypothetical protein